MICAKGGDTDAYCITNSTRPLLCLGARGTKGGRKTILYVEAVRKYREELKEVDFEQCYKLALPMFKDRLEQTFLVLKDSEIPVATVTGSNQVPIGSKRQAETNESNSPKRPAT